MLITSLPMRFNPFEVEERITVTTVEETLSKGASDAAVVMNATTLMFYYLLRDNREPDHVDD